MGGRVDGNWDNTCFFARKEELVTRGRELVKLFDRRRVHRALRCLGGINSPRLKTVSVVSH